MLKPVIAGLLSLALIVPAAAQEAGCHTMDQMVKDLESAVPQKDA